MFYTAHRAVRVAIGVSAIAAAVASAPTVQAQKTAAPQSSAVAAPNYELAAAWTAQKVSRMVFDTSVTPRWLDTSRVPAGPSASPLMAAPSEEIGRAFRSPILAA